MADLAQHLNLLSQLGCLGDRLPADDLTAMFNIIELTIYMLNLRPAK